MKKTSASPADNLSPLGGAVLVTDAAETATAERNLVVLRDPDELPPILRRLVLGRALGHHHQRTFPRRTTPFLFPGE